MIRREQIDVAARTFIRSAWLCVVALTTLEVFNYAVGFRYWGLMNRFFLDHEANVPTWFSSLLYTACALAFLLLHAEDRSLRSARFPIRYAWLALAAIVLFLSLDETGGIHEELSRVISKYAGRPTGGGRQVADWVYLYLAAFVPIVLVFAAFLYKYVRDSRLLVWWAAAAVLLMIAMLAENTPWFGLSEARWVYIIEETAEMAAPICLFTGAMLHWRRLAEAPPAPQTG